MKAGFHTVYLEERPIEVAVQAVLDAGYEYIELNAERLPYAEPHVGPLASSDSTARTLAALRDSGLPVSAVGAHCEMLSMRHADAVAYTVACIEVARAVGAPVVHVLSGARPEGMDQAEAAGRCVRFARDLAPHAAEAGVRLAWEAIVGMAIATSAQLEALLDSAGDAIGVNFDPSHLHLTDGDAVAAARRLASRTVHLHLKDAARTSSGHAFPPLGMGEIDLPGVVATLREGGYDGVASVEWEAHAVGGYPRDDAVALVGSRKYLKDNLAI